MAAFYTYVQRAAFFDFTGIKLYLDGWEMEIYTPVHIVCMCYVSCMKVARWLQHDVLDSLFVHSSGHDAEWFENFWNWL